MCSDAILFRPTSVTVPPTLAKGVGVSDDWSSFLAECSISFALPTPSCPSVGAFAIPYVLALVSLSETLTFAWKVRRYVDGSVLQRSRCSWWWWQIDKWQNRKGSQLSADDDSVKKANNDCIRLICRVKLRNAARESSTAIARISSIQITESELASKLFISRAASAEWRICGPLLLARAFSTARTCRQLCVYGSPFCY